MTESFWAAMQAELLNRKKRRLRLELANAIFEYIEDYPGVSEATPKLYRRGKHLKPRGSTKKYRPRSEAGTGTKTRRRHPKTYTHDGPVDSLELQEKDNLAGSFQP